MRVERWRRGYPFNKIDEHWSRFTKTPLARRRARRRRKNKAARKARRRNR